MTRSPRPWCNHYRGMHKKEECEAGVRFDSLPNHGTRGFMDSCPCFGPNGGCNLAAYPTADELKQQEAEFAKRTFGFLKARQAIVDSIGGPWKRGMPGVSGTIDCPVCSGQKTLRFSRASYNGHIHATCSTDGCVRWME